MINLKKEETHDHILPIILGNYQNDPVKTIDLNAIPGLLIETNHNSETISVFNFLIYNLLNYNVPEVLRFAMLNSNKNGFNYDCLPGQYITYFGRKRMVKNGIDESNSLLDLFVKEIETRYNLLKDARVRNLNDFNKRNKDEIPFLVIFVNDFREFSNKLGKEFEIKLARLVTLGKSVGINLIIATSRIDLYVKSVYIDDNFPVQMIFNHEISPEMDKTIIDSKKNLNKLSDFLYVNSQKKRKKTEQFSYNYIENKEFIDFLKELEE